MLKKLISLTIIFSMLSIDLVRAMEPDEERGHLQRRLSAAVVANDEERPPEKEPQIPPLKPATLQESVLIEVDEKADEQTPLLDQFKSHSDRGENVEEGAEEDEKKISSGFSKLKDVNALRSILIADPEDEHSKNNNSEDEDSMSPDSHIYLFLGEREEPDLENTKARLQQIENRSSFLKWDYWDNIFNKMTYAIWLRQSDATSSWKRMLLFSPLVG